jgi:hypothetical protein
MRTPSIIFAKDFAAAAFRDFGASRSERNRNRYGIIETANIIRNSRSIWIGEVPGMP